MMRMSWSRFVTVLLLGALGLGTAHGVAGAANDELTVGMNVDPVTLDPRHTFGTPSISIVYHIADKLVFVDSKLRLIPQLATAWEWKDSTTLRLTLRKGVTFHNGEPFTAESVKYTIESTIASDSKSYHKSFLRNIASVEVVDDHTVDLKTSAPFYPLLWNLTFPNMLPPKAARAMGAQIGTKLIGTGPYRLVEYLPGQRVVVERNEAYWGPKPKVRRIVFRIIPEDGTRMAALQTGEVLLAENVPYDQIARIEASPNLSVAIQPGERTIFMAMRFDRPPFSNRDLRLALNHAIDREAIIKHILSGRGDLATAPVVPLMFGYHGMKPYPYDPTRARELLAKAGHPQGLQIKFGSSNGRNPMDKQVAEAIVGQLARVGIQAELDAPEWGTFLSNVRTGKYDVFMTGYGAASGHPDALFAVNFESVGSLNKYRNEKVDALLAQARRTADMEAAKRIYAEVQQVIWEDAPWAALYFNQTAIGVNKRVKGFVSYPSGHIVLRDVTLE